MDDKLNVRILHDLFQSQRITDICLDTSEVGMFQIRLEKIHRYAVVPFL